MEKQVAQVSQSSRSKHKSAVRLAAASAGAALIAFLLAASTQTPVGAASSESTIKGIGSAGYITKFLNNTGIYSFFGVQLNNSFPTVASVTVPAGSYLVFGKAIVQNLDGSDQTVLCKLSTGDESTARLPDGLTGTGIETISVQDTVQSVPDCTAITMTCATYNSVAANPKLTAIPLDSLN